MIKVCAASERCRQYEMEKNPKQPPPTREEEPRSNFFHLLGTVSTVGINLVVSTFVGLAIGLGLDKLFGTSFLKIIFLVLGIIAGFIHLFRVALKSGVDKDSIKDNKESRDEGFK